jgi:uncharacterized membrane protein YkvA (DUF1232 family)
MDQRQPAEGAETLMKVGGTPSARPSWSELVSALRLSIRLLRDRRVPWWSKLIPLAAVAYVVVPFDLFPDVLPGVGQLDDLLLLWGAYHLFVWLCPDNVVEEHRAALARPVGRSGS